MASRPVHEREGDLRVLQAVPALIVAVNPYRSGRQGPLVAVMLPLGNLPIIRYPRALIQDMVNESNRYPARWRKRPRQVMTIRAHGGSFGGFVGAGETPGG
jgi:hypothetical protein